MRIRRNGKKQKVFRVVYQVASWCLHKQCIWLSKIGCNRLQGKFEVIHLTRIKAGNYPVSQFASTSPNVLQLSKLLSVEFSCRHMNWRRFNFLGFIGNLRVANTDSQKGLLKTESH